MTMTMQSYLTLYNFASPCELHAKLCKHLMTGITGGMTEDLHVGPTYVYCQIVENHMEEKMQMELIIISSLGESKSHKEVNRYIIFKSKTLSGYPSRVDSKHSNITCIYIIQHFFIRHLAHLSVMHVAVFASQKSKHLNWLFKEMCTAHSRVC